jgi:hypothetical protein
MKGTCKRFVGAATARGWPGWLAVARQIADDAAARQRNRAALMRVTRTLKNEVARLDGLIAPEELESVRARPAFATKFMAL